jgi:hypothetical protein
MTDAIGNSYPGQKQMVNNLSAGLFNTCLGLGQIVAPLYATTWYKRWGWQATTDTVATFIACFAVLYLFLGQGACAFCKSCRRRNRVKEGDLNDSSDDEFNLQKDEAENEMEFGKPPNLDISAADASFKAAEESLLPQSARLEN